MVDALRWPIGNVRVLRRELVVLRVVDQHELMVGRAVREVIVDALMLEQPAHEGEIRLVVLHAVLARRILLLQRVLQPVAEAMLGTDGLDDVDHR
jgi:hypothetical protein